MFNFRSLILLAPISYLIHHYEEHIVFNFREWRTRYFLDNNQVSTEEILIWLSIFLLIIVFIHMIKGSRASSHLILFFLMTTQVMNALFHVFFSIYFNDLSPGTITAVLLYLPTNYLIINYSQYLHLNTRDIQ